MKKVLRFLLMLVTALALMLVFRVVGLTICTVEGDGLKPLFIAGDRVRVNRWSYGLRVGGSDEGLFSYGRLWRQQVHKGDIVAFEHPETGDVLICCCKGLPGDTLDVDSENIVIPSLKNCADADYYWMEAVNAYRATEEYTPIDSKILGFISEEYIIGRVFMIAYSHDPEASLWTGWHKERWFLSF